MAATENDLQLLNTTLAHEYLGMAAYEAGIRSGLLSEGATSLARGFQKQHDDHAAKLREVINAEGGVAVKPLSQDDYWAQLPLNTLANEGDVVRFAAQLEMEAAVDYLNQVEQFKDPKLGRLMASISGDEAMHWAVLRSALGLDPVPVSFVPADYHVVQN